MRAADTNLLARFVLQDDAKQSAKATALLGGEVFWLPTTVAQELFWVLKGAVKKRGEKHPDAAALQLLKQLLSLGCVVAENDSALLVAIAWADQGMDFEDALHLASSQALDAFVSFDENLFKRAKRVRPITHCPVVRA